MLIKRKSLVVHEFPARVCCGGVLWVSVPSGVVGCRSFWLLHYLYVCIASAVCDFLISAVWRKLTNKGCASSSVWDWVKREVKLLKCLNRLLVIRAWAVAELLSGYILVFYFSNHECVLCIEPERHTVVFLRFIEYSFSRFRKFLARQVRRCKQYPHLSTLQKARCATKSPRVQKFQIWSNNQN